MDMQLMEKREGGLEMQSDKPWNMGNTQSVEFDRYRQTRLYTQDSMLNKAIQGHLSHKVAPVKIFILPHFIVLYCTATKGKLSRQ